jgi:hypothetical protein
MERFSQEWWDAVECIPGCANCCPKHCRYLGEDKKCLVHPSKLGVTQAEAERFGRGMGCHSTPVQLFTYDVYCPAVVTIFEEELGITIPHHTSLADVELLTNYDEAMRLTDTLRGFGAEQRALKRVGERSSQNRKMIYSYVNRLIGKGMQFYRLMSSNT